MQPVMTFAVSAPLRERMFLAYNTRAYPANRQILLELLATRQQIASVLGFRSWADLATADQMMVSAANVRAFLAKLDESSRDGARREHELVLDFARQRQSGLGTSTLPAAPTGTSSSAVQPSTSIRNPCGLTSPMRR